MAPLLSARDMATKGPIALTPDIYCRQLQMGIPARLQYSS
jgi:hypothetical protein